jgi:hypothetical protein
MKKRTFMRPYTWICFLFIVLMLGGCTKEKALALKAAAEAFRDRAVAAIDNYETLMVNGAFGPQQSDTEQLQQVQAELKATAGGGKVTSKQVSDALNGTDVRERQLDSVRTSLTEVRLAYVAYAASLARLPEGSLLAGDAVTCAAGLGARLTQRMAVFAEATQRAPVRYQYRFGKAVGDVNRALTAKNDDDVLKAVGELIETRKAEKRDNATATAMFADAVEVGTRTASLARSYGELSVEDLLSGLNQILEIRTSTFGVDSTKAMDRLSAYRARLEQDPAIKPILAIPLTDPLPACKTQ